MVNTISTTFGTRDFLSQIIDRYPERQMYLFEAVNHSDTYEIVDVSNTQSVFNSLINYDVLEHAGIDNWRGYISYVNIDIDANQQKVLDAKFDTFIHDQQMPANMESIYSLNVQKHASNRVILTTWSDSKSVLNWYREGLVNQYFGINQDLDSNYFETIYQAAK